MFKVVAASTTNEARISHVSLCPPLIYTHTALLVYRSNNSNNSSSSSSSSNTTITFIGGEQ